MGFAGTILDGFRLVDSLRTYVSHDSESEPRTLAENWFKRVGTHELSRTRCHLLLIGLSLKPAKTPDGQILPFHLPYGARFEFGNEPRMKSVKLYDSIGSGSGVTDYLEAVEEFSTNVMPKLLRFGNGRNRIAHTMLSWIFAQTVNKKPKAGVNAYCVGAIVSIGGVDFQTNAGLRVGEELVDVGEIPLATDARTLEELGREYLADGADLESLEG